MNRYYLDKMNLTNREDRWNTAEKQRDWKRQRDKYGFDERETWDICHSFYCWLYERLQYYVEHAEPIDLDYRHVFYDGNFHSEKYILNILIKRLAEILKIYYDDSEATQEKAREINAMFIAVLPTLYW